ncbi:heparinase II/III domain-containing protein [Rubrimonas cliftonensis]|uniref:Uncharacterized conserved protein, heparinase superfamily n=1 Tax=Rubrimonas cliftonensis TaxID=89524 RepID=A0A1H3VFD8_9RHOB|nr:heparinase II/III family protein [Rubrimonas cliftonensis]SDZ73527.1 Uncharacterized conserved protein, heparinase superfamily [Rubrimonas cliftonensis]
MSQAVEVFRALGALAGRRLRRWGDRWSAWMAARRARPAAPTGGALDPLETGDPERARLLAREAALFRGAAPAAGAVSPFSARAPSPEWSRELADFGWLDDALAGVRRDRASLRGWVYDWLKRGGGGADVWRADVAGRRLGALACAWPALRAGATPEQARRLALSLDAHVAHVARRMRAAPHGLGRLEAAAGLVAGAAAIDGRDRELRAGLRALGAAAEALIDGDGGLETRNPADLARAVALLGWVAEIAGRRGEAFEPHAAGALARAAPALRAVVLGDGGLARFHGAGPAADALADPALARAAAAPAHGARGLRRDAAMGFARLSAGRAALIVDAGPPPPTGVAGASALALEFAVGRERVFGAIGPGAAFGAAWAAAARATAAHSAVEVADVSSSRLGPAGFAARVRGRRFRAPPPTVSVERARDEIGQWLRGEHDGYLARFGAVVSRRLLLAHDGRDLRGEDTLSCPDAAARRRFDAAARRAGGALPFLVRFHLAPEVSARLEGGAVVVVAPSGAEWRLRAAGAGLRLEESASLDDRTARRRESTQIVLAGAARDYWGRVAWALEQTAPEPARRRRPAAAQA